ncbi:MAG: transposase [Bacteroidales bacterium]
MNRQVCAFDSSTIDLCLSVFWWAKFRKNKGEIKLHTLFDINTDIPAFVHLTPASIHDVNAMDYTY